MKPAAILTAVRLGERVLRDHHAAIDVLWRKFGIAIRSARRARRMSLKSFAVRLGYTSSTMVAMLEAGERRWPVGKAEKAVAMLNRPEQWPDAGRAHP